MWARPAHCCPADDAHERLQLSGTARAMCHRQRTQASAPAASAPCLPSTVPGCWAACPAALPGAWQPTEPAPCSRMSQSMRIVRALAARLQQQTSALVGQTGCWAHGAAASAACQRPKRSLPPGPAPASAAAAAAALAASQVRPLRLSEHGIYFECMAELAGLLALHAALAAHPGACTKPALQCRLCCWQCRRLHVPP